MRRSPLVVLAGTAGTVLAVGLAGQAARLGGWREPIVALGVMTVVLYAAGVLSFPARALNWAIALLGLQYVAALYAGRGHLDPTVPVVAAALFLCSEFGWLAVEARRGERGGFGRLVATAGVAAGGLLLAAGAVATTSLAVNGSPLLTAAGVATAVGALAGAGRLLRRAVA